MQYKNNFLDIIKNLQKNLLVKNYNYTRKDRFDLDKKSKTFDESFYIARKPSRNREGLQVKISDHDKLYKLKSTEVSNIFKVHKNSKNKTRYHFSHEDLHKDLYKFYGEEDTSFSNEGWDKIGGNRTLIELEPQTLHSIFKDVVSIKKEFDRTMKSFKNEKEKSNNLLELFFVMNNIEVLNKRLSKLDNKNSNSNDEHNCYCDDDNYSETLHKRKLTEDIEIQNKSIQENIDREKVLAEKTYINSELTELNKRKIKLINQIKINKLNVYAYGDDENIDEKDIDVERLIDNERYYNDEYEKYYKNK
jgi:hypothetical protein